MSEQISRFWEWARDYEGTVHYLGVVVPLVLVLLTPLWLLFRFWLNRPKIVIRLEKSESDEEAVVRIANLGHRAVQKVAVRWVRRSAMDMEPIPQPTYIPSGDSISAKVAIDRLSLLAHGAGFSRINSQSDDPLGWVEIIYPRVLGRSRTGRSILYSGSVDHPSVASSLALGHLPRRSLMEALPWFRWIDERLGFASRRKARAAQEQARADAERLRYAIGELVKNGIDVEQGGEDGPAAHSQLYGELSRREWSWEFSPGGIGYETVARKTWPPSSSMTLVMAGETLFESLVLALEAASRADREHGTNIGTFRSTLGDRDPLNFPPGDSRHDTDFY